MADGGSAVVAKRQLGMALRAARERLQLGQDVAAERLSCSVAKISRIEGGLSGIKAAELRELLDLYQVAGEERSALEQLGAQTRSRRSRADSVSVPDWFRRFVDLEGGATEIKSYDIELVTGVFQIEDYARAVLQASPLTAPGEVEQAVRARAARRQRLLGDTRVSLHVIMSEGVLHQQIGGPEVMRRQLAYLREVADRPNVTLQVMPFDRGAHASSGFGFTLLRLPNAAGLDVVYLEDATSARYVDHNPEEQNRYAIIWSYLTRTATTESEAKNMLDRLLVP